MTNLVLADKDVPVFENEPGRTSARVHCLGLPGIPAQVDVLTGGGIYAIEAGSLPIRLAVIVEALCANLIKDIPCALITTLPLGKLLARARDLGVTLLDDAARRGQLKLFASIGDYTKNIFRFGAARFVAELERHQVWLDHFILVDQAEHLFTLHDETLLQEQANIYHQWMRDHHHTALYLFVRAQGEAAPLGEQHGLLSYMNGCARIVPERDHLRLDVQFWHSPEGAVMGLSYPLGFSPQGRLQAALAEPGATGSDPAADEEDVYFSAADLTDFAASQAKGRWIPAESLVGILHATRAARAATVILGFGHDTNLQQLAEAVHTLRHGRGERLRIIVRETDASLRYPNELLLLRLGANLIVHRHTPPGRLLLGVESLRGQIFARRLDVSFKEALSSIRPGKLYGEAIAGPVFCEEVGQALARAAVLGVPFTLVVAQCCVGNRLIDDIAGRFRLNREGDLLTVYGEYCLLFLHACPADNASATFARLLDMPVADLFVDVQFHHTEPAVLAKLAELNLLSGSVIRNEGSLSPTKRGAHGRTGTNARSRRNSTV